ncbi:MAG: hypothetical protein ACRD5Z_08665 [Bryobacteraceae bacterium]
MNNVSYPGGGMFESVLRCAPEFPLPLRASAALEIVAADLSHAAGRGAIRSLGGRKLVRYLASKGARFAALFCGRGPTFLIPFFDEDSFIDELAEVMISAPRFAPGPCVLLPFDPPALRVKLLAAARTYELAMAAVGGQA